MAGVLRPVRDPTAATPRIDVVIHIGLGGTRSPPPDGRRTNGAWNSWGASLVPGSWTGIPGPRLAAVRRPPPTAHAAVSQL
jgi:hypothetical protein